MCQDILLFFVRSKRCARLRSATITLSFQLVRKVDSAIEESDQDTESTTSQKKHSGEIISKFLCTSSITCVSYFDNTSPFWMNFNLNAHFDYSIKWKHIVIYGSSQRQFGHRIFNHMLKGKYSHLILPLYKTCIQTCKRNVAILTKWYDIHIIVIL